METDDLIALLAETPPPMRHGMVGKFLAWGAAGGMLATVVIMGATLKIRPDLAEAMAGAAFWTKFAYTLCLAGLGLWLVERQSRAAADSRLPIVLIAVPVVALLARAVWQCLEPGADVHALLMGHTAKVCSSLILLLSLPIFAGLFWAMRKLTPTRLTLAGASAGLLAGAASAAIYCFHCPEAAAPFVLVWYSLGIALATVLGALVGRWALRW
jgi:hypothetical protein